MPEQDNKNGHVRWSAFVGIIITIVLANFGAVGYVMSGHAEQPHKNAVTHRQYDADIREIKSSIKEIERLLRARE